MLELGCGTKGRTSIYTVELTHFLGHCQKTMDLGQVYRSPCKCETSVLKYSPQTSCLVG